MDDKPHAESPSKAVSNNASALRPSAESPKSEFFKPFNFVSLLIGVAGLVSGYYFYQAALPATVVHYIASTKAVALLEGSVFQVVKDGQPTGAQTIYQTDIGIWNAGNTAILKQAKRRDFTIEFTANDRILDSKISDVRQNISGFKKYGENGSKIVVDWDYFDPGFSFIATIYHITTEAPQVSLRYIGDIEIVRRVSEDLFDGEAARFLVILSFVVAFGFLMFGSFYLGSRIVSVVAKIWPFSTVFGLRMSSFIGGLVVGVLIASLGVYYGAIWVLSTGPQTALRQVLNLSVPSDISRSFVVDASFYKSFSGR